MRGFNDFDGDRGQRGTASSARVELAVTATAVRLTVRDDGVGLPEQRHDSGLANLTKRTEELGGWLDARTVEPLVETDTL